MLSSTFKGQTYWQVTKNLWFDLDILGLLLLSAAICLILIPLTLAASAKGGWHNGDIVTMLGVGLVALAAFAVWERSETFSTNAFFPKELFHNQTIVAGVSIAFFYFSTLYCQFQKDFILTNVVAFYLSVFPYFSSYLLIVQGQSVAAAGRITQIFSFSSTVTAFLISLVIRQTSHYKYFITVGSCIYLAGIILLIQYRSTGTSTATLVACQIAVGIGGGLVNVPVQLGVQASASHQQVAAATAAFLTILEIGGAVGAAISGAIWSHYVPEKLNKYLPPGILDQAQSIYGNVTLASTGWAMGTPERSAINRAYQETMTIMLTVACCVCLPLAPLSLAMENYRLDQMDQKVKGTVIGSDNREEEQLEEED